MDKYIGEILEDRYEIQEVIGVGGMAVVYKAMDHRLNRLVAIKILKDDYSNDAEFRRRFHGESQAVAMMSHPNIVSVYDVSKGGDVDYIVMELIDGITLKQYMEQKGPLSWRETLHFAMQIAKALEHAHSRNIIHRDIKPHNVMILKDGSVKVADFGIARVASASNTLTKEALGSVHYISPEQAKGARVDNRTDIYSLGVVMYEMLTGRPPYNGETPVSVAIQHINGTPLAPSLLNSEIPTGLEQITMHAMCSDLNIRYASVTDMLQDMEEFRKDPTIRFTFLPARVSAATGTRAQQPLRPKTVPARQEAKEVEYVTTPEDKRRRAVAAVGIVLSIAALVAVVLLGAKLLRSRGQSTARSTGQITTESARPDLVKVPQLVGKKYAEIDMDAAPYCYLVFSEKSQVNRDYEDGVIFDQSIPAGDKVQPGTELIVFISLGDQMTMPDVSHWMSTNAKTHLEAMNMELTILIEQEYDDEVKKDYVIRTDPEAGTGIKRGQVVKIYVSKGKEPVPLPDFRNKTAEEAQQALADLGLRCVIREAYSNYVAPGVVVAQSPDPETELEADSIVELTVSKGKETVEMPNLVGKDYLAYASPVLQELKLAVTTSEEHSDTYQAGTVISQSPQAGAELSPGATVTLVISSGPEEIITEPPETDPPETEPIQTDNPPEIQTEPSSEIATDPPIDPPATPDASDSAADEQG